MMDFLLDLRLAVRSLVRRPGFTIGAVATLAIGIGATTAMFAAVHRLIMAPLPFQGGERMGYVWLAAQEGGMFVTPRPEVAAVWAENARTLENVERYESATFTVAGDGGPDVVTGSRVSPTLAATLGVRPILGRYFGPEDAQPGRADVVLLDEGFWQRRYGGDASVLGRQIVLDGVPHSIVGVMPSLFASFNEIGGRKDLWVPYVADPSSTHVSVLIRRREDAGREAVEAELNAIASNVPDPSPMTGEWQFRIMTPDDLVGENTRRALLVLFGAVGVVLLIACANVAGLLLARGEGRRKEIAIRAALGAGLARILRHTGSETVLIALAGGALGLLLGTWSLDLMRALRPEHLDMLDAVQLDARVLAFAAALSIATAALFGIAPIYAAARMTLAETMKGRSGGSTGTASSSRIRSTLVTGQIALSLVLLVGALLLIRTVLDLQRRDLGFRAEGLLRVGLEMPETRYATPEARIAFLRETQEAMRAVPGVESAAITTGVPPQFGVAFGALEIEGRVAQNEASRPLPAAMVDPEFFAVLGIPVLEGRTFAEGEKEAVMINASTARRYWPGESAVGKRMRLSPRAPWSTVIGVVGDVAAGGPAGALDREQLYHPMASFSSQNIVVRARGGDALALVSALRAVVARIDAEMPLRDVSTVEALMAGSIARQRFNMTLLTAFAAIALVLAAVGLYGLISYSVAQRRREIGVRIAIGAAPRAVRGMVVRSGLRLGVVGLVLGGIAAFALVRVLEGLLHGVETSDPIAFGTAALAIAAVTLLASWLPAVRASAVDPLESLRAE